MKEAFEKIKEKLEVEVEYQSSKADKAGETCAFEEITVVKAREKMAECYEHAIEIVNQVAEGYVTDTNVGKNNGWIPCSEGLPNTEHISGVSETVLVTTNNNSIFTAEYHGNGKWLDDVADWSLEVIAWQPLPAPYQPKGD